ncbi:MAG: hypothetical protein P1U40_08815 [Coxiellaceae bacterium]|nr:hypothetical protein [Coxiellaceae bacterium]
MKILVITYIEEEHWQFNNFYLDIAHSLGEVTFVCPERVADKYSRWVTYAIPNMYYGKKSKLLIYLGYIRALRYLNKKFICRNYDVVFFLSYENVSFFIAGVNHSNVLITEHNNISGIGKNKIKRFIFKWLTPKAISLSIQEHMLLYTQKNTKRRVRRIKDPCYLHNAENWIGKSERMLSLKEKIVFVPAYDADGGVKQRLKKLCSNTNNNLKLIARGKYESGGGYEFRPFFHDYTKIMEEYSIIFIARRYDYRVSNICYEALGYGKPLVMLDCLFARELRDVFPGIVYIVEEVELLLDLKVDYEGNIASHKKFIKQHSFEALKKNLEKIFEEAKLSKL